MIITGGVNVYPAEIENVLDDHPQVAEVAVFGIPDDEWGEAVCAVIVCTDNLNEKELIKFAKERLSGPKVPKKVFIRSDLPKTGSGKVLKRELKQWVQENS